MMKFVTVLAATTLLASTIAIAEENNTNPNDVLQTVPHQNETMNIAENDAANTPAADQTAAPAEAAKPVVKKHHKKHHRVTHHHKTKPAATEPAAPAATDVQ